MPAFHHSVFLQAGCPSCHPTNGVEALMAGVKALKAGGHPNMDTRCRCGGLK